MKKVIFVVFGALLSVSVAFSADVKENAKAQAADIAGQALSGKSAKEITANKKAEAKEAAKDEAGKQINNLLNKF